MQPVRFFTVVTRDWCSCGSLSCMLSKLLLSFVFTHQLAACMSGAHQMHFGFGYSGMMFTLLFVPTPFDCRAAESARRVTDKNTHSTV